MCGNCSSVCFSFLSLFDLFDLRQLRGGKGREGRVSPAFLSAAGVWESRSLSQGPSSGQIERFAVLPGRPPYPMSPPHTSARGLHSCTHTAGRGMDSWNPGSES